MAKDKVDVDALYKMIKKVQADSKLVDDKIYNTLRTIEITTIVTTAASFGLLVIVALSIIWY